MDSLITFTSFNDSVGGWDGLVFDNYSDNGTSSFLKNCIIEKGNDYNIYCYGTNQPTIDSCVFRSSANYGINFNSSSPHIVNSQLINNTIGLYANNSSPYISNVWCFKIIQDMAFVCKTAVFLKFMIYRQAGI